MDNVWFFNNIVDIKTIYDFYTLKSKPMQINDLSVGRSNLKNSLTINKLNQLESQSKIDVTIIHIAEKNSSDIKQHSKQKSYC